MKIYKTQKEVEKDIKDYILTVNESVTFECSINIDASLKVAGDIKARDINAGNINAWNINAWNINARDINAGNIKARDINAGNIKARDIKYYAFCCVYNSITCLSIKGKSNVQSRLLLMAKF